MSNLLCDVMCVVFLLEARWPRRYSTPTRGIRQQKTLRERRGIVTKSFAALRQGDAASQQKRPRSGRSEAAI